MVNTASFGSGVEGGVSPKIKCILTLGHCRRFFYTILLRLLPSSSLFPGVFGLISFCIRVPDTYTNRLYSYIH